MNTALKFVDIFVFSLLLYFAYGFYSQYTAMLDPSQALNFDLIVFGAMFYVVVRQPDVNTITLVTSLAVIRLVDMLFLPYIQSISGFVYYSVALILLVAFVIVVWLRPLIFSRIWLWKGNPNFAVTQQDNVFASLLTLQAVFMLLMLVEHGTRKFGPWWYENSRILYNNFESIQLLFTIAGILILYYMTHDKAKAKRPDRETMLRE